MVLFRQFQSGIGQFLPHIGVALRRYQDCGLDGGLFPAQGVIRIGGLRRRIPESFPLADFRGRRRRHYDRLERRIQRLRRPLAVLADGAGGLQKGLGAVGFVQDDDAVVGGQPGVHRPGAPPFAVGAEQQRRAYLVNRGGDDGRLARVAFPATGLAYPPAQAVYRQRRRISIAAAR